MGFVGSVSVYCCTWNVGGETPPRQDLSKLLGVDCEPHPDVIFLGLQEVVRSDEWYNALKIVMAPLNYVLIKYRNCWAIWIYAFVKRYLLPAINNIESEMTAFGYAGIMGNKGACSVRFEVCGVNIACVSAHFTPHPEKLEDRINDYRDVLKDQTFRDPDVNLLMDHDYIFWMGDLNFRTEGLEKDAVEHLILSKRIDVLMEYDQLRRAMKNELAFLDFKEGEITFPPTFKYDKGTKNYDSSKKQRVPSYTDRILYMAHNDFALEHNVQLDEMGRRMPQATCKRAVRGGPSASSSVSASADTATKERRGENATPKLHLLAYDHLPNYICSDHRPVFARFHACVPSVWFQLPVRFIQPVSLTHSVDKDLRFLYVAMDPPPLTTEGLLGDRSRSRKIQYHIPIRFSSSEVYSRCPSNESQQLLVTAEAPTRVAMAMKEKQIPNNLLDVARTRLSVSCEGLELHPPATLRVRNLDWIAVLPIDFYNLWKDDLVSVFSSNSTLSSSGSTIDDLVEGDMKRSEKLAVVRNCIPISRSTPVSCSDVALEPYSLSTFRSPKIVHKATVKSSSSRPPPCIDNNAPSVSRSHL
uniref:Phosphatidylinositol 45 bisphosphate n=1 Tax=Echinococcus granulosus TaxID=6210 RepID=A0A068WCD5_ECHGR|nr:phosphatidylinositol 45 bisphosphate [Echinococcus granulosus]